jgi:hypothetical protein
MHERRPARGRVRDVVGEKGANCQNAAAGQIGRARAFGVDAAANSFYPSIVPVLLLIGLQL